MFKSLITTVILICFIQDTASAQQNQSLPIDSSRTQFSSILGRTTFGGYGNAFYSRDNKNEYASVNLERFVLLVTHKFNNKITLFSELEVEDAKVEGGKEGGEIALEQFYLKFDLNPSTYLVAGLFIPRIGILSEDHLPTQIFGNERNQVETKVLPATWREIGAGIYGKLNRLPISFSACIVNGLNSENFEHGTGIREGRAEGRTASANNLAIQGSVQYYKGNFKAQISGYYGGTVGLVPREADSLQLTSGAFGTPVMITEANIQYFSKGFSGKILGAMISIPEASDINRAYANNTPETETGGYIEVAYNFFANNVKLKSKALHAFVRYETLNLNSNIPGNGIIDHTLDQQHIVTGINYLPNPNVVVKMDVRFQHTGNQNPDLLINPSPTAPKYYTDNSFFNLGIGVAF
ncbi:hypothetical protein BH11BAC2_BH11BAC2_20190 [soil metagenome]